MGFSDPSGAGDARALADDLEALLRRAGLDGPYVFVAGSAGGLTIELFAREHPQDVAGLVWLDGVTGEIADEMADAEGPLVRRAALAKALANVGAIGWFDPHGFGSGPDEARNRARAYHHAAWDTTYAIVRAREASFAALRTAPPLRGDVPLVVLVHERAEGVHAEPGVSARWRAAEERFARRSSRGRFIVSTGSGHHPEDDRPDLVAALVRAMVEDHRGR
jgi:pimeloyl-ACP methyl ester carboxylesterase